jgi:hypothetical protein
VIIVGRLVTLETGEIAEVLDSSFDHYGQWFLGVMLKDGSLRTVEADGVKVTQPEGLPS